MGFPFSVEPRLERQRSDATRPGASDRPVAPGCFHLPGFARLASGDLACGLSQSSMAPGRMAATKVSPKATLAASPPLAVAPAIGRSAAAAPSRSPQPETERGMSMVNRISGTSAAAAARPRSTPTARAQSAKAATLHRVVPMLNPIWPGRADRVARAWWSAARAPADAAPDRAGEVARETLRRARQPVAMASRAATGPPAGAGPVEPPGHEEGRHEGHRKQREHGDLTGEPFEHHGLSRRKQPRLVAGAHRAARVADHAAGQRLVHDLREVVFADGPLRVDRDAQLPRRQPPAQRRQDGLQGQRSAAERKPAPIRASKAAQPPPARPRRATTAPEATAATTCRSSDGPAGDMETGAAQLSHPPGAGTV
jgi:hypothetical protein